MEIVTRQTYDILTWLGDVGGLYDGIKGLGSIIMSAFSTYSMKTLLLTTMFRTTQSNQIPVKVQNSNDKQREI